METKPRKQTDIFVMALLSHCNAVEIQVAWNLETEFEKWSSVRVASSLAEFEPLRGWLGAQNARQNGQILIRPAAEEDHPWLLLDDVPEAKAMAISRKYAALVVWTSKNKDTGEGNCQVRLLADRPLSANERLAIQGEIVARLRGAEIRADTGSTSGVKMGRLPGFRNRKPGRDNWTNLLADTTATAPRHAVVSPPSARAEEPGGRGIPDLRPAKAVHGSGEADGEGGYVNEFSFACNRLRDGWSEHAIIAEIAEHAIRRGKRRTLSQALKYAETTVCKAGKALYRHR